MMIIVASENSNNNNNNGTGNGNGNDNYVTGNVKRNLDKLGINLSLFVLQQTCLLGTARILREVLDIP